MNAISRDFAPAQMMAEAMARDLLGATALPAGTIDYHTVLPALVTGGHLSLVESTWPAGTACPRHAHAAEDEILVVLSGTVEVRMGGHAFRYGPGQTVFIPRGLEHEVRAYTRTRHIAILTRKSLETAQAA